jgi:hypothetical protein
MAVTVVERKSTAKPAKGNKPAKPAFTYNKIITPATKRGGKDEASNAKFPTFAELVEFLKGKVEYVLDKDGMPTESCVVSYVIDGWNLESNQNAAFAAMNTPASAVAKVNEQIAAMAAKFGMTVEQFKAQL